MGAERAQVISLPDVLGSAHRCWTLVVFLIWQSAATFAQPNAELEDPRPNLMVILADDLGFSDLGCFGGEINTPNLDGLANDGLRYTQFYNTGRCWPTRASLLTGYYPHQVGFDTLPGVRGHGHGPRPPWARLVPARLSEAGYHSYHAGKWHLDGGAIAAGFDRSYRLEDFDRFFRPQRHLLDDQPLPPVDEDDFYSTTFIADQTIAFLKEHAEDHRQAPFFCYVAFLSPHFPLQAPAADIERYRQRYQKGWDSLRESRLRRITESGILDCALGPLEPDVGPPYAFPKAMEKLGPAEVNRERDWDQLTIEQQEFQAAKMSIHAAMVDRMDQEVGRIIRQLQQMESLDNTLILFLSDNGASAEIMVRGDGHNPDAPAGSAESYLCLGPGWSRAANTPLRRHKTWVHEGGIATPLIAHWPAGISAPGELRNQPVGHVMDIVPTLLELANVAPDADAPPSPGESFAATFQAEVSTGNRQLWWFHEGNRAYREGDWKAVAAKGEPWELFDISSDRGETRNLANQFPDRLENMTSAWEAITNEMAAQIENTQEQ